VRQAVRLIGESFLHNFITMPGISTGDRDSHHGRALRISAAHLKTGAAAGGVSRNSRRIA